MSETLRHFLQDMKELNENRREELRRVKPMLDAYIGIRTCLFDTHWRDVLKDPAYQKNDTIELDNAFVHEGDCIIDAGIYLNG